MPIQDTEGRTVYVTGFLFATASRDRRWVALIHKNRPAWQAGLINGIGGKVEHDDGSLADAMVREFHEESGIRTGAGDWHLFAQVVSGRSMVHFFIADLGNVGWLTDLPNLKQDGGEPCEWFADEEMAGIDTRLVPSLRFLLPLAREREFNQTVTVFQWTDLPRTGEGT